MDEAVADHGVAKLTLATDFHLALSTALELIFVRRFGPAAFERLSGAVALALHAETFEEGLSELGIDAGESDAIRCARFHYETEVLSGHAAHFVIESERKAWIFHEAGVSDDRWTGMARYAHGPAWIGGIMAAAHAQDGQLLGNERLGFVITHLIANGDAADAGYWQEFDRPLTPSERLSVRFGEEPPNDAERSRPPVASESWSPERRASVRQERALDRTAIIVSAMTDAVGALQAAEVTELALRMTLFQTLPELIGELGRGTGSPAVSAATLFAQLHELAGDGAHLEVGSDGARVTLSSHWADRPERRGSTAPDPILGGIARAWQAVARELDRDASVQRDPSSGQWLFTSGDGPHRPAPWKRAAVPQHARGDGLEGETAVDFFHVFFMMVQLVLLRRVGEEAVTDLNGKVHGEHQKAYFLEGVKKLGLMEETPSDTTRSARYHYLSNKIFGVNVAYAVESDRKAWLIYIAPVVPSRWGGLSEFAFGPSWIGKTFASWHANNGTFLGNPRVSFVVTQLIANGDPYDAGYWIEHDHEVDETDRLTVRLGELPPPDVELLQPEMDADSWPESRRLKGQHRQAIDYASALVLSCVNDFGPHLAAEVIGLAMRYTLQFTLRELLDEFGSADRAPVERVAALLVGTHEMARDTVETERQDGAVTVRVEAHWITRTLEWEGTDVPETVANAYVEAWAAVARSIAPDVRVSAAPDLLSWRIWSEGESALAEPDMDASRLAQIALRLADPSA